MSKITLYTANPSRGTNVRWMLTECGADYDNVVLDYPQLKEADYLAINPMGKVPAIKHAGQVITELPAILTYLAELFPEKRLIPAAGTPERGQYYRWLSFGSQLEYAILDRWRQVPQSEEWRRSLGYGDFDTALHTLQTLLSDGREYAVGQYFSALDIYLTALLSWGMFRAQVLPNAEPFAGYMQRHLQREAAKATLK
ncbi:MULTISPECIES: glutathione S-transferase family protein [Neisseria]|jgi:glutathione S-transferase|uniref:glutathione S-transferase family protein n=1 Tax=Neisseria TaxID=482 RepID=UPI00022BF359|nr:MULTISPECIES: glutathione S-transferase family protein [Neisseria]EGY62754.1 hypothetical protein HMPREF1028_00404 [Neisseria sp. GT4A_CT1]OFL95669.1 glutathione S-transferase [Neisseria sp. HMSC074B07]